MRLLSILIARIAAFVSRLAGNAGTSLPGMWATKVDRRILAKLGREISRGIIIVTGTNGKTTTTNIATQFLEGEGYRVICNSVGSNMYNGIVSTFLLNAPLLSKMRVDYAVLEVDELYTVRICEELTPDVFVVTNLYPDQADRFGTVENVRSVLARAIEHTKESATLVLNRDNEYCVELKGASGRETIFFGMDDSADYRAMKVEGQEKLTFAVEVDAEHATMSTQLSGDYNVSNILCAIAIAHRAGISLESCAQILESIDPQPGRMELFDLDEKPVMLNMAKNPAGFNRSFDSICDTSANHDLFLVLNNTPADGVDTDWYDDIEFERIDTDLLRKIYVAGTCAEAMATRLRKAGFTNERLCIIENSTRDLASVLEGEGELLYVLSNYTATFPIRKELVVRTGLKG